MRPRTILSVGNFFFSLFSALIALTLFPYLSTILPTEYVGFVVAGGAIGAIIFFPFLPQLVERLGAQRLALSFALVEMAVLFFLAAAPGLIASILLMAVTIAIQPFLSYELDLLLEATIAGNNTVGQVHALFRTAWNIASLAAPLLLGALLATTDAYGRVFVVAAAMLAPLVVLFTANRLPRGPAPKFAHMQNTLRHIVRNRDLAAVTVGNLVLYLFYVWAPLYVPVYLHDVLGFPWTSLGLIFSVMLIPYVIVEYPAGWIADRYLGDKELMFGGFLIAGASLAALSVVTATTPLVVILIILTISRVGSALTESMVEAHFFRRVSKRDINSVSVYRSVWPLSYIIAPIIGGFLLIHGGYHTFFLVTGALVMAGGGIATLLIKDFR